MFSELNDILISFGLPVPSSSSDIVKLEGGVSSEVWRLNLENRPVCVKRSLRRLNVLANWECSTRRNLFEYRWIKYSSEIIPDQVPKLIGHDAERQVLLMEYLPLDKYFSWRQRLLEGDVSESVASQVASAMGRVHSQSTRDPSLAGAFFSDAIFFETRIDPYLLAIRRRHPHLEGAIERLIFDLSTRRVGLVHGDVCPKNVLIGPFGTPPVIIDAECAWYGDPAFDVGFCLSSLFAKAIARRDLSHPLNRACEAFVAAYLSSVDWEPISDLNRRAAGLCAAILLARVDGKVPVPYLAPDEANEVRALSVDWILNPPDRLELMVETLRKHGSK